MSEETNVISIRKRLAQNKGADVINALLPILQTLDAVHEEMIEHREAYPELNELIDALAGAMPVFGARMQARLNRIAKEYKDE